MTTPIKQKKPLYSEKRPKKEHVHNFNYMSDICDHFVCWGILNLDMFFLNMATNEMMLDVCNKTAPQPMNP